MRLLQVANTSQCYESYSRDVQTNGASDPNACKNMVDCLYSKNGDINKADWSSALVLLGLTPTILGQLGPDIKEKARLGFQSPILGFLCVLGGPCIPFTRPWTKQEAKKQMRKEQREEGNFASEEMWIFSPGSPLPDRRSWTPIKIFLNYLLSAAAAANVLHNVITLGQQTVLSWKCTWTHLQLAWVFSAVGPVLFSGVALLFEKKKGRERSADESSKKCRVATAYLETSAKVFDSLSNILCAGHVVFGTILLSSALFIGTLDALGVVARFAASTLVCQLITALELDTKVNEKKEDDGMTTTDQISIHGPWLKYSGCDDISGNMLIGAINKGEANRVKTAFTSGHDSVTATLRDYKARGIQWVVIGDWNDGDGSSREHAAQKPYHLGGLAVISRSFPRILKSNLEKQGILPLTFSDPADYDKIHAEDKVDLMCNELAVGKPMTLRVHPADGSKAFDISLNQTFNASQIE
ncbi:Aconitate hydratase, mitochondrial [Penicillium subrubescens]|uniref:Aconitate hydratase, mitochondrial n=1 Tax=Penicillium subrubescens TaxID=1316194 RepID=A0A1Q5T410_9EURO|nr:Aconitate hydratase, mitochondrial [Penicillium subrubescens]